MTLVTSFYELVRHCAKLVLFIFVILSLNALSDTTLSKATLSSYFIAPQENTLMDTLAKRYEIVQRNAKGFEILVPAHLASEFLALVPKAKLIQADISAELRKLDEQWANAYHDFSTVEQHLQRVAEKYPEIAHFTTYGKSQEERPLFVLKLSDNVQSDENEPELMFTSATHGNELISVEVLLGLLDNLVDGYKDDSPLKKIIDEHELFFIPVVNPDGYVQKIRYANGVDPNREYPSPNKPNDDPNECIDAIIKFFHQHDIKGSLDFHSYGGMYMYPWAYTYEEPEDKEDFKSLTSQMAETNGYRHGQIGSLIWPVAGSSADYYYWKNKTLALGVEVAFSHAPDPSEIPEIVKNQVDAFSIFIEFFE